MNENKSTDNEKQTEGNKDSPVMVTDLPTVLPEAVFLSIVHIQQVLRNNYQEDWEYINSAGRLSRLQGHRTLINVIFLQ